MNLVSPLALWTVSFAILPKKFLKHKRDALKVINFFFLQVPLNC